MLNINNTNKKYNEMLYDSRPVKVSELVSDKNNKVHKELYIDALTKFAKSRNFTLDELFDNYKVIEIKNNEYWEPSSIVILSKKIDYKSGFFTKEKIDLAPYWNNILSFYNKTHTKIKISKDDNINDYVLTDINYVNGNATLKSKISDKEIIIDFDHIDNNIKVDDNMKLTNTFSYMYQNLSK